MAAIVHVRVASYEATSPKDFDNALRGFFKELCDNTNGAALSDANTWGNSAAFVFSAARDAASFAIAARKVAEDDDHECLSRVGISIHCGDVDSHADPVRLLGGASDHAIGSELLTSWEIAIPSARPTIWITEEAAALLNSAVEKKEVPATIGPPLPDLVPGRPVRQLVPVGEDPRRVEDITSSSGSSTALGLLRLSSLRVLGDLVESFRAATPTAHNVGDLNKSFGEYLGQVLVHLRLRSRGDETIDADVLQLADNGVLEVRGAPTDPKYAKWLPHMRLRFGKVAPLKPKARSGVATYCLWKNLKGHFGVAVAHNVRKKGDLIFYRRTDSVASEGLGWFRAEGVPDMYKPPPRSAKTEAPYASILSAPIFVATEGPVDPYGPTELESRGILNVTSTRPHTFDRLDCAWAEVAAATIGGLYGVYESAVQSFTAPVRRKRRSEKSEHDMNSSATMAKIQPWRGNLREDEYLVETSTLGDQAFKRILKLLQTHGIAQLRIAGLSAEASILNSLEKNLGPACERQNLFEGKVKSIRPADDGLKNSGDTARDIGLHVDGTQHEETPAVLAFQYISEPKAGGESVFVDCARVLQDLGEEEAGRVVGALAHPQAAVCSKRGMRYEGPLFWRLRGGTGVGTRVRFDEVLTPSEHAADAFEQLRDACSQERYRLMFKPREGDIVVFDNWRLLHARDELFGNRVREHNRMWISDLHEKHRPDYLLGVRGIDGLNDAFGR